MVCSSCAIVGVMPSSPADAVALAGNDCFAIPLLVGGRTAAASCSVSKWPVRGGFARMGAGCGALASCSFGTQVTGPSGGFTSVTGLPIGVGLPKLRRRHRLIVALPLVDVRRPRVLCRCCAWPWRGCRIRLRWLLRPAGLLSLSAGAAAQPAARSSWRRTRPASSHSG